MTIQQALTWAREILQSSLADKSPLDAEILLAHTINQPRSHLFAWPEKNLTETQAKLFANDVQRRCNNEPIAYITGHREFWSLDLQVTTDTLIPRQETELLVTSALEMFAKKNNIKIADLGTGSGAIALALAHEQPLWQIYATDISQNALQIASKNAQQLKLNNISFYQGNWCTALPCSGFDAIVSNPPYVAENEWETYAEGLRFEPRAALVADNDGLSHIRQISQMAKDYLQPGGYVLVEHGFLQGEAVRDIFAASGYLSIHSVRDLAGNERVTIGRCQPR